MLACASLLEVFPSKVFPIGNTDWEIIEYKCSATVFLGKTECNKARSLLLRNKKIVSRYVCSRCWIRYGKQKTYVIGGKNKPCDTCDFFLPLQLSINCICTWQKKRASVLTVRRQRTFYVTGLELQPINCCMTNAVQQQD